MLQHQCRSCEVTKLVFSLLFIHDQGRWTPVSQESAFRTLGSLFLHHLHISCEGVKQRWKIAFATRGRVARLFPLLSSAVTFSSAKEVHHTVFHRSLFSPSNCCQKSRKIRYNSFLNLFLSQLYIYSLHMLLYKLPFFPHLMNFSSFPLA